MEELIKRLEAEYEAITMQGDEDRYNIGFISGFGYALSVARDVNLKNDQRSPIKVEVSLDGFVKDLVQEVLKARPSSEPVIKNILDYLSKQKEANQNG